MTVLAFMQNMWVRDPVRVKKLLAAHSEEYRRHFIKFALFRGCLSGRRLRASFADLCDKIVWDEITREIGGSSDSYFPPDLDHMIDVARTVKPVIVVTFGNAAWVAVCDLQEKSACLDGCQFVRAMHPASRHPDIMLNLREAACQLDRLMAALDTQPV